MHNHYSAHLRYLHTMIQPKTFLHCGTDDVSMPTEKFHYMVFNSLFQTFHLSMKWLFACILTLKHNSLKSVFIIKLSMLVRTPLNSPTCLQCTFEVSRVHFSTFPNILEPGTGFEPAANSLQNYCSTTELSRQDCYSKLIPQRVHATNET